MSTPRERVGLRPAFRGLLIARRGNTTSRPGDEPRRRMGLAARAIARYARGRRGTMKTTVVAWLQRIALVGFGLGLSIVLLEAGLRTAGMVWLWLRARENAAALDATSTIRVLCVGESTTALGGPDAYPRKLEMLLNRQGGGRRFR